MQTPAHTHLWWLVHSCQILWWAGDLCSTQTTEQDSALQTNEPLSQEKT